jgi:hypothetical protein
VEKLRGAGLEIDEKARPDIHLWENVQLLWEIRDRMRAGLLPLFGGLVKRQKKQQAKWAAFFEHYDVLFAPVALTVAFPHDHKEPLIYRRLVVNGKKRSYLLKIFFLDLDNPISYDFPPTLRYSEALLHQLPVKNPLINRQKRQGNNFIL